MEQAAKPPVVMSPFITTKAPTMATQMVVAWEKNEETPMALEL
jgi:hypothetical protein